VQKKSKKSKGTHIREIQAFQKDFQTVYDSLHLKRTVNYAAKTLRNKVLDKIPIMKFPPFTPNKYLFALHFKMKFPPLPTSELSLAFRPPYPKWLPYDSLLGMRQRLITREKDKVTWTIYYLHTFRSFLHLGLPYIEIISPIGIGKILLSASEQTIYILSKKCYLSLCRYVCSCSSEIRRRRGR